MKAQRGLEQSCLDAGRCLPSFCAGRQLSPYEGPLGPLFHVRDAPSRQSFQLC